MTLVTSSYTNGKYEFRCVSRIKDILLLKKIHLPGSKMIKLIKIVYLHVIEHLYSSLVLWENNTKWSER